MFDLASLHAELPSVLALLGRIGGLFATAPFFSGRYLPVQVKAALVLCLSVVMAPLVHVQQPATLRDLAVTTIAELLFGMFAGFVASLVFVAVQVTGQVFDQEMGFGMTNVLDPAHGVQVPLMGGFFELLALALFLSMDGHHFVLAGMLRAPALQVAEAAHGGAGVLLWVFDRFCESFAIGLRLGLPVLVASLVAMSVMAIVSRAVSQLNILAMSLPIRILMGLSVLAATLPSVSSALGRAFAQSRDWIPLLSDMLVR